MNIKKRGSIIVEAALVIPIFFLAILSLILLIRMVAIEIDLMEDFSFTGQKQAREMYLTRSLNTNDGLVDANHFYELDVPLPFMFNRQVKFQERLVYRGFVGRKNYNQPFGFDKMETSGEENAVFVFPKAGERYHRNGCRMIDVYPVEKILSPVLKTKYSPCKLCKAKELAIGSKIYCFEHSGKVYHKGTCATVERYVIEMDKEEAIEKGYSPCAFCRI